MAAARALGGSIVRMALARTARRATTIGIIAVDISVRTSARVKRAPPLVVLAVVVERLFVSLVYAALRAIASVIVMDVPDPYYILVELALVLVRVLGEVVRIAQLKRACVQVFQIIEIM